MPYYRHGCLVGLTDQGFCLCLPVPTLKAPGKAGNRVPPQRLLHCVFSWPKKVCVLVKYQKSAKKPPFAIPHFR